MRVEDMATWLGMTETARQMGVSRTYAFNLARAGRLRVFRTRIGWLVDPASIAEFQAYRKAGYLAGNRRFRLTPEQVSA